MPTDPRLVAKNDNKETGIFFIVSTALTARPRDGGAPQRSRDCASFLRYKAVEGRKPLARELFQALIPLHMYPSSSNCISHVHCRPVNKHFSFYCSAACLDARHVGSGVDE